MSTKFKFVKKVDGYVNGYNGKKVKTGDIVEIDDMMLIKATVNPDYELVKAPKKPRVKKQAEPEVETAQPAQPVEQTETPEQA